MTICTQNRVDRKKWVVLDMGYSKVKKHFREALGIYE